MKHLCIIALSLLSAVAYGQTQEHSVITGQGYNTQIWYHLGNGEVAMAPMNDWDLAFEIQGFTSSILINGAKGVSLYESPYAMEEWALLDTAGLSLEWIRLHNDPTNWSRGAFNQTSTNEVDLGWGIYNFITHVVAGNRVYAIKLANNVWKKLRIDALASGVYTFTHANLDGSDETTVQVAKASFPGKNFGYYRFEGNTVLDREPSNAEWDITFCRFVDLIGPNNDTPYGVMGVLQNKNRAVARAAATPVEEAGVWDFAYSTFINTIGWDWKQFNFSTGFVIVPDLSFFVQSADGNIYHLVFTSFEGSSTGFISFETTPASLLSTHTAATAALRIYPNPASNGAPVHISIENSIYTQMHIHDLHGRLVYQGRLNGEAVQWSPDGLTQGLYLITFTGNGVAHTTKLVVQ